MCRYYSIRCFLPVSACSPPASPVTLFARSLLTCRRIGTELTGTASLIRAGITLSAGVTGVAMISASLRPWYGIPSD